MYHVFGGDRSFQQNLRTLNTLVEHISVELRHALDSFKQIHVQTLESETYITYSKIYIEKKTTDTNIKS